MPKKVKVSDLVREFQLEIICGDEGLKRPIMTATYIDPGWNWPVITSFIRMTGYRF